MELLPSRPPMAGFLSLFWVLACHPIELSEAQGSWERQSEMQGGAGGERAQAPRPRGGSSSAHWWAVCQDSWSGRSPLGLLSRAPVGSWWHGPTQSF